MITNIIKGFSLLIISIFLFSCAEHEATATVEDPGKVITKNSDPLPSWNDVNSKKEIIAYVADITKADSPSFIPKGGRIATFDNDGTLWSEQPAYFQLFFAIDKIKKMAVNHPEWNTEQPFKAVLENNMKEPNATRYKNFVEVSFSFTFWNKPARI